MIGQDPYHGPGQAHGTRLGASLARCTWAHTNVSYPSVLLSLPYRSLFFRSARCYDAPLPEECKPCFNFHPFHPPPPPSPSCYMTAVTHKLTGASRSIRKSKPNMKGSFPQSTGA